MTDILSKTKIFDKKWSEVVHTVFEIRQDSDYDDFYEPSKNEAEDQLKNAKGFVDGVAEIQVDLISEKIELPHIE